MIALTMKGDVSHGGHRAGAGRPTGTTKPNGKPFVTALRLDAVTGEKLVAAASAEGVTVSAYLREVVRAHLEKGRRHVVRDI